MVDQLQFAWITLVALRYLSSNYHGRCRGKNGKQRYVRSLISATGNPSKN
jgi:hypothetical protein